MNRQFGTANIKMVGGIIIVVATFTAVFALIRLDVTGEKGSGLGREFVYDIKDLGRIDAGLITYEESGEPILTGFGNSSAIATNSKGDIYLAGDNAVKIFSSSRDLSGEIKLAGRPRCLTVNHDGTIYVGMKDHVEVYNRQKKLLASWQSLGERAVLTSIAVYKDNVFVADAGNRVVVRYDTAGNVINYIGRKDKDRNIPGFVIPSPYFDLAVGGDGLLRVVSPGRHRIEAYTFDGDLEFWWGKASAGIEGFCGCCNPVNFAILTDESFVTCEKGLTRAKIYDADGNFVGVVAGPEQLVEGGVGRVCNLPAKCQAGGFDVAVDANGRIFVLDTIKNVVRIFSRKRTEQ